VVEVVVAKETRASSIRVLMAEQVTLSQPALYLVVEDLAVVAHQPQERQQVAPSWAMVVAWVARAAMLVVAEPAATLEPAAMATRALAWRAAMALVGVVVVDLLAPSLVTVVAWASTGRVLTALVPQDPAPPL
jgi:hypothetical protein